MGMDALWDYISRPVRANGGVLNEALSMNEVDHKQRLVDLYFFFSFLVLAISFLLIFISKNQQYLDNPLSSPLTGVDTSNSSGVPNVRVT